MKRIACIQLTDGDGNSPIEDRRLQVVECCGRFTPIVGFEATDPGSVLLDITGLAHLFGGERAMIEAVVGDLGRLGFGVRAAVAETIGAAWAAVQYCKWQIANCKFEISDLKFEISDLRSGISDLKSEISNLQSSAFLNSLPVEALRLPGDTVRVLHELGLVRVGQLEAIPREQFLSRFGPGLLRRMDQAFGRLDEPVPACPLPPKFAVRWLAEHATARRETIAAALERLIGRVAAMLARCGRGALRLDCRLDLEGDGISNHPEQIDSGVPVSSGVDGRRSLRGCEKMGTGTSPDAVSAGSMSVGSEPVPIFSQPLRKSRATFAERKATVAAGGRSLALSVGLFQATCDARRLFELVELQLERLRIGSPVTAIHVAATLNAALEPRKQATLFELEGDSRQPRRLAALVERLSSRLGSKAVVGVRLRPEAQPELSWHYDPLVGGRRRSVGQRSPVELPPRPLRLLPRPQALGVVSIAPDGPPLRFRFDGEEHAVARSWGPERIETGWWRGQAIGRDYYRVETAATGRYWVFRRLRDGKWFLHGMFE